MTDKIYVILKRGYYFRPNAMGYTAFLEEAGLYDFDDVQGYCDNVECTYQLASDAKALSPMCGPEDGMRFYKRKYQELLAKTKEEENGVST